MSGVTASEIISKLKSMGDKQRAAHSQKFFKTGPGEYAQGDIFLGITVPELRKQASKLCSVSLGEIKKLLKSPLHEVRLLSLLMLIDSFQRGDINNKRKVFDVYIKNTKYINNWDLVDVSAHKIVGQYLQDRSRKRLYRFVKSPLIWERRIAIISTWHFIRAKDIDDTLKLSEILLNDKEDLMHKAVGWMLREAAKRDTKRVEKFLQEHYINLPRTTLRYAIERFPETKRKKYLKGTFK